jgi:hypothetical protein
MTKASMYHKALVLKGFKVPKIEGGVGIIDKHILHNSQVKSFRPYFHKKKNTSNINRIMCEITLITHLLAYMILYHNKMRTTDRCKKE